MNRLLVVALAAALSQFALACTTERTEIYEPAPSQQTTGEKIDRAQVADSPELNFPVPAAADTPIDVMEAKVVDNHIDYINGGMLNPTTQMPPVFDPSRIEQVNVDGTINTGVETLDPNEINYIPGIGLNPLLVTDAPPSRFEAQAQPDGLPPL